MAKEVKGVVRGDKIISQKYSTSMNVCGRYLSYLSNLCVCVCGCNYNFTINSVSIMLPSISIFVIDKHVNLFVFKRNGLFYHLN